GAGVRGELGRVVGADRGLAAGGRGEAGALPDIGGGVLVEDVYRRGPRHAGFAADGDACRDAEDVFARLRAHGHVAGRRDIGALADVRVRGGRVHQRGVRHTDARRAGPAHGAGDHRRLERAGRLDVEAAGIDRGRIADVGLRGAVDVGDRDGRGEAAVVRDARRGRDREHALGGLRADADGAAGANGRVVVDVGVRVLGDDLHIETDTDARRPAGRAQR